MFVQIKAIRKGYKPPRWRRAYLPMHITFSQMAYILEVILELPETDQFEFEFYQEKDRVIETWEEKLFPDAREYSYWDAVNACVDDWLMKKNWFTFRVKGLGKEYPEYRVECEKLIDEIRFKTGDRDLLAYPILLKEVSVKEDTCWSNADGINQRLKESCFLKEGESTYPSFSEVSAGVQDLQGIEFSSKTRSRDPLLKQSTRSLLTEIGKSLMHWGTVRQSAADGTEESEPAVMLDMLMAYTKADLVAAAEETGCDLRSSKKSEMALELAFHLLDSDVMRELLLSLTETELDAFESAIKRKRFQPTEEEWKDLAEAYNLNYIAEYSDDTAEVVPEAAMTYERICRNGYRAYHADARWLIECLNAYAMLYVVGPVRLLFRMYKQREGSLKDYTAFQELLNKIPMKQNPCCIIEDKLVADDAVENDIYKRIEGRQRDIPYYIPDEKTIWDYAVHGYPATEGPYKKLYSFFKEELKLGCGLCADLCKQAFSVLSCGGMPSDYMDKLKEREIELTSSRQVELFAGIITDLNNCTRMFELKGHTPIETMRLMPAPQPGKGQVIVPMNSLSADILEKNKKMLKDKGIEVDTDRTAHRVSVTALPDGIHGRMGTGIRKIYPNDPCPCGSGKKYKKCCGRIE